MSKTEFRTVDTIAAKALKLPADTANAQSIWGILERIIPEGRSLHSDELAQLYAYLISNSHVPKPKTPERWVALAMAGKGETRYYLRYIYSDGARIMATDGHRLHIYKTTKYSPGFYDRNMKPAECDGKFPKVESVIPAAPPFETFIDQCTIKHVRALKEASPMICCEWSCDDTGKRMAINRKYLLEALAIMPGTAIRYTGPTSSVKLENGDGSALAVIMPIRV